MTKKQTYQPPTWAPRVTKMQIERFYNSIGKGLWDEELIDDVGFSLLIRCQSILKATEGSRGRAQCPLCETMVLHAGRKDTIIGCSNCGWICSWPDYKKTYQHKQLNAGGMEIYLKEFVDKFEATHSHAERIVLIDTLIHRFHWEHDGRAGRPGACNLIEGRMTDILPFLDRLTYGDKIPDSVKETRKRWHKIRTERPLWVDGADKASASL